MRVLLVEDDPESARIFSDVCALNGHRVEIASTGLQAVTKALEIGFQATMIDVSPPDMDGFALAQLLLRLQPALNCVLVSAHQIPDGPRRAAQIGARFCYKPLDFAHMEEILGAPAP